MADTRQCCKHCAQAIIPDPENPGGWVHIQRGVVPNPDFLHRTCLFPRTHAEPVGAGA